MPNLDAHASAAWLAEIRPMESADAWPPAIRPIETAKDAATLLTELGEALDEAARIDADRLATALRLEPLRKDLRTVLAQIGAARALRVLHWVDEADLPHSETTIAALTTGDTPEAGALRAIIATVTRRATLRRMFEPGRVAALQSAAEAALGRNT